MTEEPLNNEPQNFEGRYPVDSTKHRVKRCLTSTFFARFLRIRGFPKQTMNNGGMLSGSALI
jgi:hypothetical protein